MFDRMNKKTFFYIISVGFFLMPVKTPAQGNLGFLVGGGVMMYSGDLRQDFLDLNSTFEVIKPFVRAGIIYRITDRFETSAIFLYGSLTGADSLSDEAEKQFRNQSFRSKIEELSVLLEYKLFTTSRMRKFNPYVFAGFGLFRFNPEAQSNGIWYELQPLGTEGQFIPESNYAKPYKLVEKVAPVGVGISMQLNNHWRIRLDYSAHFTFTDYLDDVSTIYPDSAQLSKTPNGALAVELSNNRLDGKYPKANRSRGNPNHKDVYSHLGITIIFNPGDYYSSSGYGNSNYKGKFYKRLKKKKKCPSYAT